MNFTLIVCTYMRAEPLLRLLHSVNTQSLYPNEIIIVDGSTNHETEHSIAQNSFKNLRYFRVDAANRGLTKQRNYGVNQVSASSEIICFLDDDTILEAEYFENVIATYDQYPKALGVGGYITNEVNWSPLTATTDLKHKYVYEDWLRTEPLRFRIRKLFGLQPDRPPCILPTFSHGRSVSFLPPSNKIYPVELFMGGVSSYRLSVFNHFKFSTYFEGYGLYEDADFCLRLSKTGDLYVNTSARLSHHHDHAGRPNTFKYGKMVIRNGWYVWRVKYECPSLKARLKWNATAFLLTITTLFGVLYTSKRKQAVQEAAGRIIGWWSLIFNKPKLID